MKRVGVREFRDRATKYLLSGEAITVERHGKPIGYYIPIRPVDEEKGRQALERFRQAVDDVLANSDLDEETLAAVFDLNRPFDYETGLPAGHEVGR
jgi:antitoxin (DNA-binding transcriptional repressor) of toxin-antitoxin stability system